MIIFVSKCCSAAIEGGVSIYAAKQLEAEYIKKAEACTNMAGLIRLIDRACELACDESVIKKFDNAGKQSHGETLIMAAADTIRKTPVSITMFKDKRNLKERLGAIMKHKDLPKRTIYVSCVLFAVISYGTFCLGTVRSSTTLENEM